MMSWTPEHSAWHMNSKTGFPIWKQEDKFWMKKKWQWVSSWIEEGWEENRT
jgi:hypothetical protein